MSDNWERNLLEKVALAAVNEQRRARRWGIFFKLAFLAYLVAVLLLATDIIPSGEVDQLAGDHTAMVDLRGVIADDTEASADIVMDGLDSAFESKNVKGVVLVINSPGGSPVQSAYIHDEILRLKKEYPEIPIAVVVEDICASGAYLVAVAADKIYVNPSSLVGSIGVRMDSFGFTGAMEKVGIERRLFTAGANKGMLDPFLPLKPEQVAKMQGILDEVHQQFIDYVKQGRGKRLKEDEDTFSGLVWTGSRSVELGLADGFGTVDSIARDVFKAEKVVDYTAKESVAERLARKLGAGAAERMQGLFSGAVHF